MRDDLCKTEGQIAARHAAEAEVRTLRNAIANEGERIERLEAALRAADDIRDRYGAGFAGAKNWPSVIAYDAARALCNAP